MASLSNMKNSGTNSAVSVSKILNDAVNYANRAYSHGANSVADKVVSNLLKTITTTENVNSNPAEVITANYNASNALAQSSANDVNQFNKAMLENQQAFNADEAEKNRLWQEELSNTAHQREVIDLQKAGLNPILSANGGSTVGAGATASSGLASGQKADVNFNQLSALATLYSTMKNTELTEEKMRQDYDLGSRSLDIQEKLGILSAENGLLGSYAMAGASRYAAEMSYNSTKYINDLNHPILTLASELMGDGKMSSSEAFAGAIRQITGGNNHIVNALINSFFGIGDDSRGSGSHSGSVKIRSANEYNGRGGYSKNIIPRVSVGTKDRKGKFIPRVSVGTKDRKGK